MRPESKKPKKPAHTAPAITRRRAVVEKAIRERGWSEEICVELQAATSASRATLYRDRDAVLALLAEEETATLPQRRAMFLGDLRRLRRDSAAAGSYAPAAKLLALEGQILGVDQPDLPEVADTETLDVSMEGVLRDLRRLRRRAEAGSSFVAAEKMLEREAELVRDIAARDQAQREEEMAHLDEDALVDAVVDAVGGLTDAQRAKLRAALG